MADQQNHDRTGGRPPEQGRPSQAYDRSDPDLSFILQAVFEIQGNIGNLQKAIGSLESTVKTLSKQVDRQQRAIGWITRTLWVAAGALLILGPIVAWILNNRFDRILDALANGG